MTDPLFSYEAKALNIGSGYYINIRKIVLEILKSREFKVEVYPDKLIVKPL